MNNQLRAYLGCALWSSVNSDSKDDSCFDRDYCIGDFTKDSITKAESDLKTFERLARLAIGNEAYDALDEEQLGYDLWLTRNRHGAGFWDRGLGEIGDKLTEICRVEFNEYHLMASRGKVKFIYC
jgi:hypothetical protein